MSVATENMSSKSVEMPTGSGDESLLKVDDTGRYMLRHDRERRGHVYRISNRDQPSEEDLIQRGFDYPVEMTTAELVGAEVEGDYVIQRRYEGTILRMSVVEGELMVSTHKMLNILSPDGMRASWGNRPFSSAFQKFVLPQINQDALQENHVYILLLQDPDNRLVSRVEVPGAYHLTTLVKVDDQFHRTDCDIGLPKPEILEKTVEELCVWLDQQDPLECAGAVILSDDPTDLTTHNVVTERYRQLLTARANNPYLLKRALALEKSDPEGFQRLCEIFPEYAPLFNNINERITKVLTKPNGLLDLFRRRHVGRNGVKENVKVVPHVHKFLISLRDQHVKSRQSEHVFYVNYNTMLNKLCQIPVGQAQRIIQSVENDAVLVPNSD